jgi:hypothetical protein
VSRYLHDLGFEVLLGKKIVRALFTGTNIVLSLADGTHKTLTPDGDCCSECFINDVDGADALKGGTLLRVEDLEMTTDPPSEEACGVVDRWGHRFITDKGTCTIGMRLEHNGYYGGSLYVQKTLEAPDAPELVDFT